MLRVSYFYSLRYERWKQLPGASGEVAKAEAEVRIADLKSGKPSLLKIVVEAFTLIFIAEWDDDRQ
jgi:hypothetical protein